MSKNKSEESVPAIARPPGGERSPLGPGQSVIMREPAPPRSAEEEIADYAPKKGDPALRDFDEALNGVKDELNAAATAAPAATPGRKPYPFVDLAKQVADAMVQAAEQALNEAQSNLEAAKLHAEKLTQEIAERDEQLGNLTQRIEAFGARVLKAHSEFHNGRK